MRYILVPFLLQAAAADLSMVNASVKLQKKYKFWNTTFYWNFTFKQA